MNDQFNFPATDYDLAGEAEDLDPTDLEIVELMESVFGLSGPEVIARLLKFADYVRSVPSAASH